MPHDVTIEPVPQPALLPPPSGPSPLSTASAPFALDGEFLREHLLRVLAHSGEVVESQ